jgi:hypothetical protein
MPAIFDIFMFQSNRLAGQKKVPKMVATCKLNIVFLNIGKIGTV